MPIRFWATAKKIDSARNTSTGTRLTRSSARLAFRPIVVKKAIISGCCRLVSRVYSALPWLKAHHDTSAMTRPPTTGSGRLYLPSSGM